MTIVSTCEAVGCYARSVARGLCQKHYAQEKRREKGTREATSLGPNSTTLYFRVPRATAKEFYSATKDGERSEVLRGILEDWLRGRI